MNRSVPCVQELREMGDSYARNEFKAHKKAQIGQVKMFAKEWKEYAYTIELQAGQGPGAFGRHLDESKVMALNEEQKENLRRLEQEAKKAGRGKGD